MAPVTTFLCYGRDGAVSALRIPFFSCILVSFFPSFFPTESDCIFSTRYTQTFLLDWTVHSGITIR